MARLPVNGASDRADPPLTVEVIEEGFRSLGLNPGTTSAILLALVNIATSNATTTAASQTSVETHRQETALLESDDASDARDRVPSEAPTTTAASPLLTPAATVAPICIKDAVSTSSAHGVLTPVVNPADVQPIVAPAIVTTTAAPVAVPAADSPVAVPTAAATFATTVAAVVATPTPIAATPIVAAPTSTTAPAVPYHLPAAGAPGPYYCVTRGRDIGVFAGWEHVSPIVIGVSRAIFGRVDSIQEGQIRMDAAVNAGLTARL